MRDNNEYPVTGPECVQVIEPVGTDQLSAWIMDHPPVGPFRTWRRRSHEGEHDDGDENEAEPAEDLLDEGGPGDDHADREDDEPGFQVSVHVLGAGGSTLGPACLVYEVGLHSQLMRAFAKTGQSALLEG